MLKVKSLLNDIIIEGEFFMFLAIRELKHQKLRYGLISLIIFLIVFLVLFITGLANGLASDNGAAINQGQSTAYVLEKGAQNRFNRSTITAAQAKEIKRDLGNGTPIAVSQTTVQKLKTSTKKTDIAYFALNASADFNLTATNGQKLTQQTGNGVLVSDKLQAEGYQVGRSITDTTSGKSFKIKGFIKNQTYAHTPVIYLSVKQWQAITPQAAMNLTYNTVATTSTKALTVSGFNKVPKQTMIQNIPGYSAETGSLTMMIAFLYIISVVVLAVFFYVLTIQKLQEFGTLKAIGTATGYLGRHLIYEIGLITLLAIAISSLLIILLGQVMPTSMPFIINGATLGVTAAIFIVVAILSSLISLVKISKVDPVSAIGGQA